MRAVNPIRTVDYHTAGEPFRIVVGGVPALQGGTVLEQRRWARGNLEMLFRSAIPRRSMSLRLRLQYIWSAMFYLTGVTALVYLALPCLFLLFGIQAVGTNSGDFIAHFLPYIFITIVILARSAEGRLRFRAMQLSYGLFPVFLGATVSALTGRSMRFHVTPKRGSAGNFYHLVIPQIVVVSITVTAIVVGFAHYSGVRTITNACWALFDVVMLSAIIRAAAPARLDRAERSGGAEIRGGDTMRLSA